VSESLYIVDAAGYLYRSYFALPPMSDGQGRPTHALYGFVRSMEKLIKDFEPEFLVAVFDGERNTESRKKLYGAYKANRQLSPEDFGWQVEAAKRYCEARGIALLEVAGVEADDVIGTLALWWRDQGGAAVICSSDKDLCQLVGSGVTMVQTHKDNLLVDRAKVQEMFGVAPEQIVDYLALTGDTSDNVPGVKGIGPKTAAALLGQFGSLDAVLEQSGEIKGAKTREAVERDADLARLSRQLVQLHLDVEIPREPAFYALEAGDVAPLHTFYEEMGFRTLIGEAARPKELGNYQLVDTPEALAQMLRELEGASEISVDTETTDLHPLTARLVGVGLCVEAGKAWYLPTNGQLGLDVVVGAVRGLLERPGVRVYGHNFKYDLHVLHRHGIRPACIDFDTIVASYVLNAHSHRHALDLLVLHYFDVAKIKISDLLGAGKKAITMDQVPLDRVCAYCCEDVDYTLRLRQRLEKELEERQLTGLFRELELPLLQVLARMEEVGIYVDVEMLHALKREFQQRLDQLCEEIYQLAGEQFAINSPKQLAQILFVKLGIPPLKRGATGYSTSADVLEELRNRHPIIERVMAYRALDKLVSTYLEALPGQVLQDGRIHCTFNQFVAATGRLSSQDPNLQNIPVRSEEGRLIRAAFKPQREGWSYLSADYSQIELRLMAHFSGDPGLVYAFEHNKDIHAHTAAKVFHVDEADVTREQRQKAKGVNFGILYGQQAYGLSQSLRIPLVDAKAIIDAYFEQFPGVRAYLEASKEQARLTERACTLIGRERLIPEINSRNAAVRAAAERLAINAPLQGSSADLIKLAMLKIDQQLLEGGYQAQMVLQIHDELLFELPDSELERVMPLVKNAMEGVWSLKVPLVVDMAIGKNWKECYA
jgi:DNA polymerase I